MMRIFYSYISMISIFLLLSLFAQEGAFAKSEAPDEMLKRITQELITELRSQDKQLRDHPDDIYKLIEKILVPHVDWHLMSQWVIGRNAWTHANERQRAMFANEFKDLLVRTYASTLRAYNNQSIEYLPIRGGLDSKKQVQVMSRIKEPGREAIRVMYRLVEQGNDWKVYDISIEGVSLLKGFQSQFAEEIQQNGIDALIKRLHEHNEKPIR